jgi:ABC-type sulfate transport system substrate-binding protein
MQVGDALLTYENEVVLTNAVSCCRQLAVSRFSLLPAALRPQVYGDKALPYVVPRNNVRIECPISTVDQVLATRYGS